MKPLHQGGHQESEHEPTTSLRLFLRCMGNEYPFHRERGRKRKKQRFRSFPWFLIFPWKSIKNCRDISQREKLCDRFPLAWIRMCRLLLPFFFCGLMEIWIQEEFRIKTFWELWILSNFKGFGCKVLFFKKNIVIFSRDWLHRITIFLFFFVPGKGQLDTFYRRDENRFMVSRWKFSTFISSRLGYKKKRKSL